MSDRLFSSSTEEASTIARHQNGGSDDRGSNIMSNTRRKPPPPPPPLSRQKSTIDSVLPIMEHSHLNQQQHQQQKQQQQQQHHLRPPPPPPRKDKRPAAANGPVKSNDNNTLTATNPSSNNSKDVIVVDLTFSPPEDLTFSPPQGEEDKVQDYSPPPQSITTKKERLRRMRLTNNDDDDDDNSVIELNSSSSSRRTKKRSRTTAGSTKTKHDNIAIANNNDDEELYEVERIVAHRTIINNNNNNPNNNKVLYKTRWKGWSSSDDTWEPSQNVASTGHIDKYERSKLQSQLIVGTPGVAVVQYEDGEKEIVNMTNEIFRTHHPNNNNDDDEEEDAINKTLERMAKGGMRDYNLISTGKWIDILWKHAKIYFPCKIITWTPPLLSTTSLSTTMSTTTTTNVNFQQQSTTQINSSNKGRTTIAADNALVANKGKRQQQQRNDDSPKWLSTSKSSSLHATAGVNSSSGRGFLLPTMTMATSKPSSSSLSLHSSSREAQVLERQRRVAGLLGGGAAAIDQRHGTIHLDDDAANDNNDNDSNNAMTTTSIEYAGTLKPNDAAETLARARQKRQQASSSNNNNNESLSSSSSQKRPSMMRGSSTSSTMSTTATSSVKSTSTFTNKGSLASILLSNTSTAKYMQPNGPKKLLKHYDKVVPDDYWKNMISWDILGELNDRMMPTKTITTTTMTTTNDKNNNVLNTKKKQQQQQNSTTTTTTTPLPDVFESYREYCALWAPLLLEEARAQLLSEIISDIPYWRKAKVEKGPVRVFLEPNKADLNSSLDIISVRVKHVLSNSNEYKDRTFMVHDIVLLMREESFIWDAYDGKLLLPQKPHQQSKAAAARQPTRFGIVGYIEYGRRSIEGLTIHVSKDLWSNIGKSEMVLIKLGCNITSLREFTALCRMDSIPLSEYILGAKMSSKNSTLGGMAKLQLKNTVDTLSDEHLEKKDILSMMGGSSALGKGFAEYASQKFNLSQLGAISASAQDYGNGGFTLIKGPPGTGKTTTLCALLNALHIRQMNQYFYEVRKLAESFDVVVGKRASLSLTAAMKKRPRILVCAPSNAAIDNVISKIMEDGFVDGSGRRYNPSMARIGRGQSESVKDVCLEEKVESYITKAMDLTQLDTSIEGYNTECRQIHSDITMLRQRMHAMKKAVSYPLAKEWEMRIDESTARIFFVNHKDKTTTYEAPPPPEPGQKHFPPEAMPEYKEFVSRVVKLIERNNKISTQLDRLSLCREVSTAIKGGNNCHAMNSIRQQVETHILDDIHIVTTTLGTAGSRALEAANKFEVVVIDEAAQSVEPSTLAGLQLGSSHAILVGDPQQLPATIFNISGRNTKYDRSLFQRLEEAGHDVHLLDTQYRMHPAISNFPRQIFYSGLLLDGPNVKHPEYGNPLKRSVFRKFQAFKSFTIFDLESTEERGGTSLSNSGEAHLALHLFNNLRKGTDGQSVSSRVAVITPYSQQASLLRRTFANSLGAGYEKLVEISSVDAFQGREANIVIFSCVRAAGSKGIGFLSDVRRMNVALTRSKHFLFVIANTRSITVNPYWRDLVEQAHMSEAVIQVPFFGSQQTNSFPDLSTLKAKPLPQKGPGATEYIRGYNHVGVVSQKNDSEGQQQSSPQPCDVAEQQVKRQTLETASKVKEDTMCRQ